MDQDNMTLFLSNVPLPQSETSVTLDIYSIEEIRTRGDEESFKMTIPEGKITLDPGSIQLFAIPPHRHTGAFSLGLDRTQWDLYLAIIPFTLHRLAQANKYYTEIIFSLELNDQQAKAFDLFPKNIRTVEEGGKKFAISKEGRFHTTEDPDIDIGKYLGYTSLEPAIQAYGAGESSFYWTYEGIGEKKAVTPENKNVLVVLRVPSGTKVVEGKIKYAIAINKLFFRAWKQTPAKVDPYPIQLDLQNLRTLFPEEQRKVHAEETPVDVCLVCALAEEAQALIKIIEKQCQVKFKEGHNQQLGRSYRQATLKNNLDEPLEVQVSWQVNPGPVEAGLHVSSFIRAYRPRFVGMTGFCAGDRKKTDLGDIVVAERAFSYETGKVDFDEQGRKIFRSDVTTWQLLPEVLSTVQMFEEWEPAVKQIKRPISRRQQKDWLLERMLEKKLNILDLNEQERQDHAPQWKSIWQQLKIETFPYINHDGVLTEHAQELHYQENFPHIDPPQPKLHIQPVATGEKVRADRPFEEIQGPVRKTVALDMEGAAFYRTLADFAALPALFVKGVSDYADPEKDDNFHNYAATVSAIYMLSFIRKYVNSERFPRKL